LSLSTDVLQGALRLLFLLDRAGTAPRPGSAAEAAGAVAVMESEKRLPGHCESIQRTLAK